MIIDKAQLRALAEAATPGAWKRGDGNEVSVSHEGDEAYWDWEEAGPAQLHGGGPQASADADFIAAANPATVLAVLSEFDQLKGESEALQQNFEILLEAASQMLNFAHPTCMNDEKWRDRVAGFAAGDRYD